MDGIRSVRCTWTGERGADEHSWWCPPACALRCKLAIKLPARVIHPKGSPAWPSSSLQVVERRTPVGGVLSAPLASMLLALAGAAMGLLPTASAAADAIWVRARPRLVCFPHASSVSHACNAMQCHIPCRGHPCRAAPLPHTAPRVQPLPILVSPPSKGTLPQAYLLPLAAACYLLESDLSQLLGSAGPTLAAFVVGAVGTLAGTLAAFWLVGPRLGPEGWKVAAALCASYIGGKAEARAGWQRARQSCMAGCVGCRGSQAEVAQRHLPACCAALQPGMLAPDACTWRPTPGQHPAPGNPSDARA